MFGARMPASAKQLVTYSSNRQRLRDADRAVILQRRDRALLLAVLAQQGGEVVVTAGTVAQLRDEMTFEIVPGATDGEKIIRIVVADERAIERMPVDTLETVDHDCGVTSAE
jgi:hypothetical protein